MSKKATARKTTAKKATAKISGKIASPKRAPPKEKGPAEKNLDIYGSAPLRWSRALKQLEAGTAASYWLATTKPDRRPHVAAVGALWVDGKSTSRAVRRRVRVGTLPRTPTASSR